MKKVVFLLVIFVAVTGAMFAQSAESIMAVVPAADYTKSDDKAVWTFAASGITIRDRSGSITISVREMRDLSTVVEPNGSSGFTFAYDTSENKRTYRVIMNPRDGVVTITIVKNGEAFAPATLTKR